MTEQEFVKPEVGQGATILYPQDRYPYRITRVSDSGKTVWAKRVETVSLKTGHEPARFDGPWPVWSHTYTEEELLELQRDVPEERFFYGKNGWRTGGSPALVGVAKYYRNYSY